MPTYVIYGYSPAALSYDPATGTYQLDPNFDFTTGRVRIEVNDDDTYFDGDSERSFHNEIGSDANQTGTVTTPSGATIASGRIYDEQFSEITLTGGGTGWIDQIEIAGQVVGFVTTFELVPGQVYTANFTQDVKFPDTLTYGDYFSVPCFEASVLIETPEGPRSARSLRAGDFVVTRNAGVQRVTWACQTTMLRTAFAPGRFAAPVRITTGTLGDGLPTRTMIFSADHRIALAGARAELLFEVPEVLVPAKSLVGLPGISSVAAMEVTFAHFACERHSLVKSGGIWSETLFPGREALLRLHALSRLSLFRSLQNRDVDLRTVRPCLTVTEARAFLASAQRVA